ncbi:MAG: hypothetical protein IH621_16120, partial [Krumholzibacteria bacterium]|nr:hypothetical protein [Candidatus Krumholzibacteria bacterium]
AWARAWRMAWLLAAVGSVGWGALGILRRTGRQEVRALLLFGAWTLAVLVFYAVVLPDRGHAGRYQPQVYVGGIVLAVEGLAGVIAVSRRLRLPAAAAALLLGGGLAANLTETAGCWATAVDHVNRLHATAARELAAEAGPDAVVAVFDVGAVAYLRPCPLVDASGLTGPGSLQALQERKVAELLRRRQVTHALLPWWGETEGPGSLRGRLGLLAPREVRLSLAATWSYAGDGWWRQFRFTGNAFRHLRLYAVEVPDAPGDP